MWFQSCFVRVVGEVGVDVFWGVYGVRSAVILVHYSFFPFDGWCFVGVGLAVLLPFVVGFQVGERIDLAFAVPVVLWHVGYRDWETDRKSVV